MFVSQASISQGVVQKYNLRKRIEPVRNCRNISKKYMKFNDTMPKMKVDPERYVSYLVPDFFSSDVQTNVACRIDCRSGWEALYGWTGDQPSVDTTIFCLLITRSSEMNMALGLGLDMAWYICVRWLLIFKACELNEWVPSFLLGNKQSLNMQLYGFNCWKLLMLA